MGKEQKLNSIQTIPADAQHLLSAPKPLRLRLLDFVQYLTLKFHVRSSGIYLLNDDYLLESYVYYDREEGAQPQSKFRVGEGVLGYILSTGKPAIIDNLTTHPNFVYRPGATDYIYLALAGYPISTEKGRVGVLTLQNSTHHPFKEEELVALAPYVEMLSHMDELGNTFTIQDDTYHDSLTIEGISFSGGIGVGEVVLHQPPSWSNFKSSKSTFYERKRLKSAIREMMDSIDELVKDHIISEHRDPQEILETYKMFASDRAWVKKIQAHIQMGLTAEAAVDTVRRESRKKYAQAGNKYLKGHLSDLEDLANRLIANLTGEEPSERKLPDEMILIANQMGPAELLDYDQQNLRGVILEEGIHTSHMAIVARAMGVPVIGRIHNLLTKLKPGEKVIVDGEESTITLHPDQNQIEAAKKKSLIFSQWKTELKELADVPSETLDGVPIHLRINAGLMIDLQHIHDTKVEGIGLYRTEIPFMMHSKFPDVDVQARLYSDVLDQAHDKPVIFRTLDLGGDKIVPYMWRLNDENPAMGWRAIRVSLDRPALLKQQLRALILAAGGRTLNVMFPLVATAQEYLQAKKFLGEEITRAKSKDQIMPSQILVGLMIETPSIVWELDQIAAEVDFLSLGTNDLFQFFFACDRTNPNLAHRYDTLSVGYLKFLKLIFDKAKTHNIPLSVCGEMAGQPLEVLALMGLGYRIFSMNVSSIPLIKKFIRKVKLSSFEAFFEDTLKNSTFSVRDKLKQFANEHNLFFDCCQNIKKFASFTQ